MAGKTFVTIALLAALTINIASAQVSCNCTWLATNLNTVQNLQSDPFQISSINLNDYYIPSFVDISCGNIGAFGKYYDYYPLTHYDDVYFLSRIRVKDHQEQV